MNLIRGMNGDKNELYKYINNERKTQENTGLLLNVAGKLMMNGIQKAEVLNAFIALVFTVETRHQESQAPEIRVKVWNKEELTFSGG